MQVALLQWRNCRGQGAECPLTFLTKKFLLTYREKRGKEEKESGKEKKENRKREFGKLEGERLQNEERTFFLLFKTTEICFGSIKMGIFYREKAFHAGKKSGKITLPLSKIIL